MDAIDLLKQHALLKRNTAILAAKREYAAAVKDIRALQAKLNYKRPGRPSKAGEQSDLKATTVAREILREGKALTIAELTIAVQLRGCRALDDPRVVAHNITSGLHYYRREFKRDETGRWNYSSD